MELICLAMTAGSGASRSGSDPSLRSPKGDQSGLSPIRRSETMPSLKKEATVNLD